MVFDGNWKVAAAVSAACVSGALAGLALKETLTGSSGPSKAPQKWIRVGTVSELNLYPIKSCQPVQVHEAEATAIGLKGKNLVIISYNPQGTGTDYLRDRIFMVVNAKSVFQTQRTLPRMILIKVEVIGNKLLLTAPGMSPLEVIIPEDSPAIRRACRIFDDKVGMALDCGDEVGKWLDSFLDQSGLRLLYHSLRKCQRERTPLQKKFPTFVPGDKGAFQDQTSYMIIAEESVEELNTRLETPVTYRNFRPSILIKDIPEPFAEDYWTFVRIGAEAGPIFKASKPCTRCKLTTVNPNTGVFSPKGEPLKTLTTMKRSYGDEKVNELVKTQAVIGLQLGLYKEGSLIKVGDPVYAAAL